MVKCRNCRAPKWRGDICATCAAGYPVQTMKAASPPITLNVKHGFHAPTQKAA
jgi:hypothetical protein